MGDGVSTVRYSPPDAARLSATDFPLFDCSPRYFFSCRRRVRSATDKSGPCGSSGGPTSMTSRRSQPHRRPPRPQTPRTVRLSDG
eukprot:7305721-Prymnesium_polylepis.1